MMFLPPIHQIRASLRLRVACTVMSLMYLNADRREAGKHVASISEAGKHVASISEAGKHVASVPSCLYVPSRSSMLYPSL